MTNPRIAGLLKLSAYIVTWSIAFNVSAQGKPGTLAKTTTVDTVIAVIPDTLSHWEKFKKESIGRIKENETRIAALKKNIANGRDVIWPGQQRAINEAERKNDSLRNRLDYYKNDRADSLESFKLKFNTDIGAITHTLNKIKINPGNLHP